MVGVVGECGAENADIINAAGGKRKKFAHRYATLPGGFEAKGGREEPGGFAFGAEVSFGRALAGIFEECGFGIEKVSLKGTAIHEQMDDPASTRWKVGFGGGRLGGGFCSEGCGKRSGSGTGTELAYEVSAGKVADWERWVRSGRLQGDVWKQRRVWHVNNPVSGSEPQRWAERGLENSVEYTVRIGWKANGKGWRLDERESRCDE